jgi:hypothetical protein
MKKSIKQAFMQVFAERSWTPMRRARVVECYCGITESSTSDALNAFDKMVEEGHILRRGGWYVAKEPAVGWPAPSPVDVLGPPEPPVDLAGLKRFVTRKFPRTTQSNPTHFCIVNDVYMGDGRIDDVRYAFRELVKDGLLEKLVEGEEHVWCGPVEEAATEAAPPPRPAPPPPPVDAEYASSTAARIMQEIDKLPLYWRGVIFGALSASTPTADAD